MNTGGATPSIGGAATAASGGAPHSTGGGGAAAGGAAGSSGSASGGATAGLGGAENVEYNPCPAAGTPCVVMPMGDSITEGVPLSQEGGYRSHLFAKAVADGKSLTFVGSLQNGPAQVAGVPFPSNHEGHGGFSIGEILPIAQNAMTTYRPNVVLLMIGTNDYLDQIAPMDTRSGFTTLLDTLLTSSPDALVFVAKIVPTNDFARNSAWIEPYNAMLEEVSLSRSALGQHVRMVDMYSAFVLNPSFGTAYLAEGLHPNDMGYQVMAGTWYQVLSSLLR